MDDVTARIWHNLIGRVTGPMSFRLVLQPGMAAFLAIKAGLADARAGRPLYAWTIFHDPPRRVEFLKKGWKDVAKVFVLALVLDVIYQVIEIRWVYPVEALLVAFLLACVPYLLLRGLVNRLFRSRPASARTEHP
jgi:hypothetical protein